MGGGSGAAAAVLPTNRRDAKVWPGERGLPGPRSDREEREQGMTAVVNRDVDDNRVPDPQTPNLAPVIKPICGNGYGDQSQEHDQPGFPRGLPNSSRSELAWGLHLVGSQ